MIVINARFLTQDTCGVQRYAEQICLALNQIRGDLLFVAPHDIRNHAAARALKVQCIGHQRGHLWEQLDLPLYLRRHGKPLLLSLSNSNPMFYSNQVATHHDITYVRHPRSYSWRYRALYRTMVPILLSRVRNLVTNSEFSRNEISGFYGVPKERILVLPAAVSEQFLPATTPADSAYLLAVSSPNLHKNFKRMIQAFLSLRGRPDLKLHIVGSANSLFADPELQHLACREPRIRFLGRLDDAELVAQYQGAAAFVFPSLYEGFGIPPLEAQACGCPVLASSTSAIPEVLRDSALYFDPLSVEQIASAMARMLDEPPLRQHLRRKGLANVTRFSWRQSAQRLSHRLDNLPEPALQRSSVPRT